MPPGMPGVMPPGMPDGMPPECRGACRPACRSASTRQSGQRSYLMFIMLITCQSLFKMDDEVVAWVASAGFLMIAGAVQFQRRHRRKTVWVKPWLQVRPVCGAYSSLISDLRNTDECAFRNYSRMNVAAFEDLLSQVEHVIVTQRTRWRAVTICPRDYLLLARDWSV